MAWWKVTKHRMQDGTTKATVYIFNGVPLSATELRDLAHEVVCVAGQIEQGIPEYCGAGRTEESDSPACVRALGHDGAHRWEGS